MAEATKLGFGVKSKRLQEIWKEKGQEAQYKDVATAYKSKYQPEDKKDFVMPSDQTIGEARKKAFGIETKKRTSAPKEPTADNFANVLTILIQKGQKAGVVLEQVKETPVNPFAALDEAAGGRENLLKLLEKIKTAQTVAELVS